MQNNSNIVDEGRKSMKNMNIGIAKNLMTLRTNAGYSLETVAKKIAVSRQAVSKWEMGISLPDLGNCNLLARLYNVTLDNLVNYQQESTENIVPAVGKHIFGIVSVGEKGQIVIPKKAREIFDIKAGDSLIVLGDSKTPGQTGIAIVKAESILNDDQNIISKISDKEKNND